MILPFQYIFDFRRANSEDKLAGRWHPILVTISFIFIIRISFCTANDTLLPGETLSGNQTLVSNNGLYQFGLMYGSLVISAVELNDYQLWFVDIDNPIEPLDSILSISPTGNLVLTQSQKLIWSTNLTRSEETNTTVVVLLDTGNLILKEEGNSSRTIWQSFEHPADTWWQGAPLGFEADTGNNIHLTSMEFFGRTFVLELDPGRDHRFIIRQLSGISSYHGTFPQELDIVADGSGLITLNDTGKNHTLVQLDYNGIVSILNYNVNDTYYINTLWSSRNSQCKLDSFCGPYGLCSEEGDVTCSCPYGFNPTDPESWERRYYSDGCSRNITLICDILGSHSFYVVIFEIENITIDDVFFQIDNITTYPDDPLLLVLKDEAECKASCLSNCSCSAYSYNTNCSLWFGELKNTVLRSDGRDGKILNIRLHMLATRHSKKAHRFPVVLVIGIIALLVVVLLISWKCKAIGFILKRRSIIGDQLVAYSYAETKSITKNFLHKLGEGGFGTVFKGLLPDSTIVAVKRMKNAGFEEKQFRTEVQTIGMIQHINLVKLLGFCSEGTRRLLVYEYMPNGSLDSHLFADNRDCLNWNTRYEIIVAIARGLTYLHEECRDCIIHCDIKPENILLDVNFCPKIADFGMAKLLGRDFSRALTAVRGTIGYLGPEWISGLPITKKADVYSFGMTLFEIVSGKRNTEKTQKRECTYFPLHAAIKINQGDILCLLDDRLQGDADMEELNIACKVACWCIQENESDRPSMRQVVHMLEGAVEVSMPPVPSFLQRLVDIENDSTFCSQV